MNQKTAEKFITIGQRGNIISWVDDTLLHVLQSNQVGLTREEYKIVDACRGDLEKAKRIIRTLEIKIKKGGDNGKQKENDGTVESQTSRRA